MYSLAISAKCFLLGQLITSLDIFPRPTSVGAWRIIYPRSRAHTSDETPDGTGCNPAMLLASYARQVAYALCSRGLVLMLYGLTGRG
jgi:hypothetical protein